MVDSLVLLVEYIVRFSSKCTKCVLNDLISSQTVFHHATKTDPLQCVLCAYGKVNEKSDKEHSDAMSALYAHSISQFFFSFRLPFVHH